MGIDNHNRKLRHVSPSAVESVGAGAPRQRSEQYFTLSQSRAHFLRQAKGRPHAMHVFVGRSAFRRIRAMKSPGHGLAAPVEEPSIGVRRKSIEDSQQMAGSRGGRMDLQPGRRERSRQRRGDGAGMQGDTERLRRSTGQFNGRGPHELIEGGF